MAAAGCASVNEPVPIVTASAHDAVTASAPPATTLDPAAADAAPDPAWAATGPAPDQAAVVAPMPTAAVRPAALEVSFVTFEIAPRHEDAWQRIRDGFAMPALDTPLVAEKERMYLANPDALQRMFARGGPYLYFIIEELEARGMPTELALLPFVESAMNPVALSHAKAAGLWQFIPATGKRYELSQDWWIDNRRDIVKSTRAALEYLQTIHEMHDRDWFLALASYNWGENAVARAVSRNRAAGMKADYLSLKMPNETRHYVPKLIALKNIVLRADELKIALPPVRNEPYFGTVAKTRPIDLKLAARFAGMTAEEFVALNPAHNRPVIAASRNNLIRLPADRVESFVAAIARHERAGKPLASWQPYTLKSGETLDEVSRRGGVTKKELLQANGLRGDTRVLAGTRLLAPQLIVKDEMLVESFTAPRVYEEVRVPAVFHIVKNRDTLATLARNYGVSIEQLRRWNGSPKAVSPGARLLVRQASTQTVLTTETGRRQIVARHEPATNLQKASAAPELLSASSASSAAAEAAASATAAATAAAATTAAPSSSGASKQAVPPAATGPANQTAASRQSRRQPPPRAAKQPPVRTAQRAAATPKRAPAPKATPPKLAPIRQPSASDRPSNDSVRAVPLRTGTQPAPPSPKPARKST